MAREYTVREVINDEVAEGTTCALLGLLIDQTGTPVPGSLITALTLTLKDEETETIINSRNDSPIVPPSSVVSELGEIAAPLNGTDNTRHDTTKDKEWHIARVEWQRGTVFGAKEWKFPVVKLA